MKEMFRGYYQLTEEDFRRMWREATFVFDANSLLNVYRYTQNTVDRFFEVCGLLEGRVWIPHQVALEYQRNRLPVVAEQRSAYDKVKDRLQEARDSLERDLRQYRKRHPYIDVERLLEEVGSAIGRAQGQLAEASKHHPDFFGLDERDQYRGRLEQLFAGRVGQPYDGADLKVKVGEAKRRAESRTPPGYMDSAKRKTDEPDRQYGDTIVWLQMLDFARDTKRPIVFVTDDQKEDWWYKVEGKTLGPRPELVEELYTSSGAAFHMYRTDQFVSWGTKHFGLGENREVIREIKETSRVVSRERRLSSTLRQLAADWTRLSGVPMSDDLAGRLGINGFRVMNQFVREGYNRRDVLMHVSGFETADLMSRAGQDQLRRLLNADRSLATFPTSQWEAEHQRREAERDARERLLAATAPKDTVDDPLPWEEEGDEPDEARRGAA